MNTNLQEVIIKELIKQYELQIGAKIEYEVKGVENNDRDIKNDGNNK